MIIIFGIAPFRLFPAGIEKIKKDDGQETINTEYSSTAQFEEFSKDI